MFTDNEIKAYQSIKAPAELYEKISKTQKSPNITLRIITTVAACFILIISSVFIFKGENNIIVNGQPLTDSVVFYNTASAKARSISSAILVPVEIKAKATTKVTALQGTLSVDGGKAQNQITITSDKTLWWEITPKTYEQVFKLQISDKKGVYTVTLKNENTKITVTKEKVK